MALPGGVEDTPPWIFATVGPAALQHGVDARKAVVQLACRRTHLARRLDVSLGAAAGLASRMMLTVLRDAGAIASVQLSNASDIRTVPLACVLSIYLHAKFYYTAMATVPNLPTYRYR